MARLILLFLSLASIGACAGHDEGVRFVRQSEIEEANRWRPGDAVPSFLLDQSMLGVHEIEDEEINICGNPGIPVIQPDITNYPLLLELTCRRAAEFPEDVATYALLRGGLNRFFHDLREIHLQRPYLLKRSLHQELRDRYVQRHVRASSIFIHHDNMPPDERRGLLDRVAKEPREGKPWHRMCIDVKKMGNYRTWDGYLAGLRYDLVQDHASNPDMGKLTIYEDVVVFPDYKPVQKVKPGVYDSFSYLKLANIPKSHSDPILKSEKGQVLLLEDSEKRRSYLYQVVEVYVPPTDK